MSVLDIALTILYIYEIPAPKQMKGACWRRFFEPEFEKTAGGLSRLRLSHRGGSGDESRRAISEAERIGCRA